MSNTAWVFENGISHFKELNFEVKVDAEFNFK